MTYMKVDTTDMKDEDYVFLVPNSLVGEGEAGDPLTPGLQEFIRWMAAIGFWPVDWLDTDPGDTHTPFWFKKEPDIGKAQAQAEHFIKKAGYVRDWISLWDARLASGEAAGK